jgi:hypothetical protein
LNSAAWTLGRWIAAGALEQLVVEDALYAAAARNGLVGWLPILLFGATSEMSRLTCMLSQAMATRSFGSGLFHWLNQVATMAANCDSC